MFKRKRNRKVALPTEQLKVFVALNFKKNSIDLLLRSPKYDDPKKLVKDITSFDGVYKGLVKIDKESDVDYIFSLIKQSYEETL
jgi:predicted transport protein